jgi:N-acetylneuraminic acid mutarotase
MNRRHALSVAAALVVPSGARAQSGHEHHSGQFERLNQPGRIGLPEIHAQQAVIDSPAPRAAQMGQWRPRAPLPIPRTEMAWAVAYRNRVHLVGGYAEQRVDKPYHHAYDPASDRWEELAQLPRGANHVGVVTHGERLYAFGGFIEQNRTPHDEAFAYDGTRWNKIRRLPEASGAISCIALAGRIHLVGGAIGSDWRRSVDWHIVYDPAKDTYERRQPLPVARDHTGIVVVGNAIHVIGGRVDSFHTNSSLHHSYDAQADRWNFRTPMPTPRSGHGCVLFRNRVFVMGGEGTNRVFGQNESWDPVADKWEQHAPMLTPRHGMGAVVVGDAIYVAGGGPQMGGGVKSAINEAFSLG